jgi:hypothetical protein
MSQMCQLAPPHFPKSFNYLVDNCDQFPHQGLSRFVQRHCVCGERAMCKKLDRPQGDRFCLRVARIAIVDVGAASFPGSIAAGFREQPGIASAPIVPTDLPAPQPPSPAVNVPAPPSDSRPTQGGTPAVFIDPQTNTIVYQVLDANTGDVIEQEPAPALLRQLAYDRAQAIQALIQGKDPNAATQKIDTTS